MGQRKRAAPYDGRKPSKWKEAHTKNEPRRMRWHLVMEGLGRETAPPDGRQRTGVKNVITSSRKARIS